ncbi:hypothetical protein ccbrp13_29740 [Ktedonobacteria bacterium brp13]|nr:hypothetical protein ccbrp13_29740 [Ktedonobacteria bacterium brp13]
MAILAHLVITSASEEKLCAVELVAFVHELLDASICSLPAGILVGQARTLSHYWGGPDDPYITPNVPGFMLDLKEAEFPQELIWYYGDDESAFLEALARMPLEEHDCCISFPGEWNGWDGAVLYILKQPLLLALPGSLTTQPHHSVTYCFTLFSMIGGGGKVQGTSLQPILARYFGRDLLLEESIDW